MIYSGFTNLINVPNEKKKIACYDSEYKCNYDIEKCSSIISKNIKLSIDFSQNDFKKDIILNKIEYFRIIGTVLDENSKVVKDVYITLYRYELINYKTEYIPMAETISDGDGFFQFIIPTTDLTDNFKVKVSKRKKEDV